MEEAKRILLTGATGFIGSYVCRLLVGQGYIVHITKRDQSRTHLIDSVLDKVTVHNIALDDIAFMGDLMDQVDIVVHCAAIITIQPHTKAELFDVNVDLTRDLVNLALASKIEHFIFLSSVAALGLPKNGVELDESNGWDDNDTHGDYGISKYRAELELRRAEAEGLNITILNPSLVLGGGFWNSGTPSIFKNLDGFMPFMPVGSNGFVDVRDVAQSVSNAILNPVVFGKRIIISGHNEDLKIAFNNIRNRMGRPAVKRLLNKSNAWLFKFLDMIRALFTNNQRLLTSEAVEIMSATKKYSNKLSKELLHLEYRPLEVTIKEVVEHYKESKESNAQYKVLSFD